MASHGHRIDVDQSTVQCVTGLGQVASRVEPLLDSVLPQLVDHLRGLAQHQPTTLDIGGHGLLTSSPTSGQFNGRIPAPLALGP